MPRSSTKSSSPAIRNTPSTITPTPTRLEFEPPTLGQSLKQGFGFGAGSAIAHRIFGAAPQIVMPSDKKVESPCEKERTFFENCMKTKSSDDFCGSEQIAYTQCLHLNNTKLQ